MKGRNVTVSRTTHYATYPTSTLKKNLKFIADRDIKNLLREGHYSTAKAQVDRYAAQKAELSRRR